MGHAGEVEGEVGWGLAVAAGRGCGGGRRWPGRVGVGAKWVVSVIFLFVGSGGVQNKRLVCRIRL